MNIVMFTNTFIPHVGGVANSVKTFTDGYRQRGHRTLVIAPNFEHRPQDEKDVVRVPAIQNFNGSDFSLSLPLPLALSKKLELFQADIIHSHHPYLLGDTALRVAASLDIPLVFTHHTMYEQYTHYVPGDSPRLQHFVIELSTGYANLCNQVIAPSESVAAILRQRGVKRPIAVIPTGVEVEKFGRKTVSSFRSEMGIPAQALVVGYLGRLAPEKNLEFWARVVSEFLKQYKTAHALIVGYGSLRKKIENIFYQAGLSQRLHLAGVLGEDKLVSAYQAMDIFAFTSKSETQGLVLVEAMAAGVPVVALNATGVREVVKDGENGRLIESGRPREEENNFIQALWQMSNTEQRQLRQQAAVDTAQQFSSSKSVDKTLALYQQLATHCGAAPHRTHIEIEAWSSILRRIGEEWNIWFNRLSAAKKAVLDRNSDVY